MMYYREDWKWEKGDGKSVLDIQLFKERYDVDGDCMIWNSLYNKSGYGMVNVPNKLAMKLGLNKGKLMLVKRLVWMLFRDEELPDMIQTTCGHRNCINPLHLKELTRDEFYQKLSNNGKNKRVD